MSTYSDHEVDHESGRQTGPPWPPGYPDDPAWRGYPPPPPLIPPPPPPGEHGRRPSARTAGGAAIGIGALLLKLGTSLKFILPALFKAPFMISILVNIALYAWLYSTQYGLEYGVVYGTGIVALIFVHEMGHLVAARMTDTETTNPFFIPMMGAVIGVKSYRNSTVEAVNGIGGPILGTIGAMAVFGMATLFGVDSPWGSLFIRLAYLGFFINFFNMIPATFGGGFTLDGGRILQAVSKWFYVAGVAMLGALVLFNIFHSVFVWIFLVLAIYGTYKRFQRPDDPAYNTTTPSGKAVIGLSYLALLIFLVVSMASTEQYFL